MARDTRTVGERLAGKTIRIPDDVFDFPFAAAMRLTSAQRSQMRMHDALAMIRAVEERHPDIYTLPRAARRVAVTQTLQQHGLACLHVDATGRGKQRA